MLSRYKRILKEMESQGKVKTLTVDQSQKIDNALLDKVYEIKSEFYNKHQNSILYCKENGI